MFTIGKIVKIDKEMMFTIGNIVEIHKEMNVHYWHHC